MKRKILKLVSIIFTVPFLCQNIAWPIPRYQPSDILYQPINNIRPAPACRGGVHIPEQYGSVEKSYCTPKQPLVVLIKDAHCNYEAQTNIAKILDTLIRDYGIDLVCVEGAIGSVNTKPYQAFPDEKIKEKVTDRYIKKGLLSASETLAICKGDKLPFTIWGVEDQKLYLENLHSYRKAYKENENALHIADQLAIITNNLKQKIYHKELMEFDRKVQGYNENTLSLTQLCSYLNNKFGVRKSPNIKLALKSHRLEKGIDFKVVESERFSLIKHLEKNLPKEDLQELVKNSLLYRLGKISSVSYYTYLKRFIQNPKEYTNLIPYIKLVTLQDRIDSDGLFREIDSVGDLIYNNLFQNKIQKELHKIDYSLSILTSLLKLQLNRKDLDYYENNREEFRLGKIMEFLRIQAEIHSISFPNLLYSINPEFSISAETFYRQATERDQVLTKNLIKKMREENKDRTVIVTGGFHSKGIVELLEKENINCVVISPKITKEQIDNPYLSLILDEKLDVEKYLQDSIATNIPVPLILDGDVQTTLSEEARKALASVLINEKDLTLDGFKKKYRGKIELLALEELFRIAGISTEGREEETVESLLAEFLAPGVLAEKIIDNITNPAYASFLLELLISQLDKATDDGEKDKIINALILASRETGAIPKRAREIVLKPILDYVNQFQYIHDWDSIRYTPSEEAIKEVLGILAGFGPINILRSPAILAKLIMSYDHAFMLGKKTLEQKKIFVTDLINKYITPDSGLESRVERQKEYPGAGWSTFFNNKSGTGTVENPSTMAVTDYLRWAYKEGLWSIELSLDFLPFDPSKRLPQEYSQSERRQIRELTEKYGIKITVHSPLVGPFVNWKQLFLDPADNIDLYKESIDFCEDIGAKVLVVHIVDTEDYQVQRLAEIVQYAKGKNVRIALENTYDKDKEYHTSDRIIGFIQRIIEILSKEDLDSLSNLSILFDAAHYNITKEQEDPLVSACKIIQFAKELKKKYPQIDLRYFIAELHLNQNLGTIKFYTGFNEDLHSAIENPGPIFNEGIIALFYAMGMEPIVTAEQLGPLSTAGKELVRQAVSTGKGVVFQEAIEKGTKIIEKLEKEFPSFFTSEEEKVVYSFVAGIYSEEGLKRHLNTRIAQAVFSANPERVSQAVEIITYHEGEEIVVEGDIGNSFYIIKSGEVSVLKGEERKEIARLKKGHFFGEIALESTGKKRTATIRAESEVEVIRIPAEIYETLKQNLPDFKNLAQHYKLNRLKAQEQEVLKDYERIATISFGVPNRKKYEEDLVKILLEGKESVQVVCLKIQDFKNQFNILGSLLGIGHILGDVALGVIGRKLQEHLNKALENHQCKLTIYNEGPVFYVILRNPPDSKIIEEIFSELTKKDSGFKKEVIEEIKDSLRSYLDVEKFLSDFTPSVFNIYGGISEPAQPEARSLDMVKDLADKLDIQAIEVAKYAQLSMTGIYEKTLADALHKLTRKEGGIDELFKRLLDMARTIKKSNIVLYNEKIDSQIQISKDFILNREYTSFHRPIKESYQEEETFENLFSLYRVALEEGDFDKLKNIKERIWKKIVYYRSSNIGDRLIFSGNQRFKDVINYIIRKRPNRKLKLTFRVGGDEYGKDIWDTVTRQLSILRFDGNNIGATTFQWGVEIGNKVIDEQLRITQETEDVRDIPGVMLDFFSDMDKYGRGLELSEELYNRLKERLRDELSKHVKEEDGKHILYRIPDVLVEYEGKQFYSRPMVSIGEVVIDVSKIPEDKLGLDYSVIQGMADNAAEKAKKELKKYQSEHNGQFDFELAYKIAEPFKPSDIKSLKESPLSLAREEIAAFIVENCPEVTHIETTSVKETEADLQLDRLYGQWEFDLSKRAPNEFRDIEDIISDLEKYNLYWCIMDDQTRELIKKRILNLKNLPGFIQTKMGKNTRIRAINVKGSFLWGPGIIEGIEDYSPKDMDIMIITDGNQNRSIDIKLTPEEISELFPDQNWATRTLEIKVLGIDNLTPGDSLSNELNRAISARFTGVTISGSKFFEELPPLSMVLEKIKELLQAARLEDLRAENEYNNSKSAIDTIITYYEVIEQQDISEENRNTAIRLINEGLERLTPYILGKIRTIKRLVEVNLWLKFIADNYSGFKELFETISDFSIQNARGKICRLLKEGVKAKELLTEDSRFQIEYGLFEAEENLGNAVGFLQKLQTPATAHMESMQVPEEMREDNYAEEGMYVVDKDGKESRFTDKEIKELTEKAKELAKGKNDGYTFILDIKGREVEFTVLIIEGRQFYVQSDTLGTIGLEVFRSILSSALAQEDLKGLPMDKPFLITSLKRSPRLFEDHVGNGFIGINEAFLRMWQESSPDEKKFLGILLQLGLEHELMHELRNAGIQIEDEQRKRDIGRIVDILGSDLRSFLMFLYTKGIMDMGFIGLIDGKNLILPVEDKVEGSRVLHSRPLKGVFPYGIRKDKGTYTLNQGGILVTKEEVPLIVPNVWNCICLYLYDPVSKVYGISHISLFDNPPNIYCPLLHYKVNIMTMIEYMQRLGAKDPSKWQAVIIGGIQDVSGEENRNVTIIRERLTRLNISIAKEDTGGVYGRSITLEGGTLNVNYLEKRGQGTTQYMKIQDATGLAPKSIPAGLFDTKEQPANIEIEEVVNEIALIMERHGIKVDDKQKEDLRKVLLNAYKDEVQIDLVELMEMLAKRREVKEIFQLIAEIAGAINKFLGSEAASKGGRTVAAVMKEILELIPEEHRVFAETEEERLLRTIQSVAEEKGIDPSTIQSIFDLFKQGIEILTVDPDLDPGQIDGSYLTLLEEIAKLTEIDINSIQKAFKNGFGIDVSVKDLITRGKTIEGSKLHKLARRLKMYNLLWEDVEKITAPIPDEIKEDTTPSLVVFHVKTFCDMPLVGLKTVLKSIKAEGNAKLGLRIPSNWDEQKFSEWISNDWELRNNVILLPEEIGDVLKDPKIKDYKTDSIAFVEEEYYAVPEELKGLKIFGVSMDSNFYAVFLFGLVYARMQNADELAGLLNVLGISNPDVIIEKIKNREFFIIRLIRIKEILEEFQNRRITIEVAA